MEQKTISWGDGTADLLTVDYSGNVGSSLMAVASDVNNTGVERSTVITFKTLGGVPIGYLTVIQEPEKRAYSSAYSTAYK